MATQQSFCEALASPAAGQGFRWFLLVSVLPPLAFMAFMALRFRRTLRKLQYQPLEVMFYYCALWVVSTLLLLRYIAQAADLQGRQAVLWVLLSLVTRCGTLMLEASVVVFLLQGHLATDAPEVLMRTLLLSGGFAMLDSVAAAVAVFGVHTPLFSHGGSSGNGLPGDLAWSKWRFYLAHALAGAACYGAMLALLARWRARLPAKPAVYAYFLVLMLLDAMAALGALLLGIGATAGYCVFGLTGLAHAAALPPLVYYTFLAEALPVGAYDGGLEDLYYSEMREAGYFDGSLEDYG
ncbi:hypothetical protein WJX81_001166 [Elliptochloris bilobata]|uniref:Transmembrane protein adipocyte-associated 1 n=1 Tax=Elliptochloris bilobata TaxID=381761 RepID=A0AAW1S874_9CHLO